MPLQTWLALLWPLRLLQLGYCYEATHIQTHLYDRDGVGVSAISNPVGFMGSVDMQVVCTTLIPGFWWYDPANRGTKPHQCSKDIPGKILRFVQANPGQTSDQIVKGTGTTIHYCRSVLRKLMRDGKVTKKYYGHSVFTYFAVNA